MSSYQNESETGVLRVSGARLYYKRRGAGPVLVMLQGGDGDADGSDAIAEHLVDRYTVLSYDRRGLSRSPIDDPSEPIDLAVHSEDAAALIDELADRRALVFGSSFGALLGLELVSLYPDRVRVLVAHEPPATGLLPESERQLAVTAQEEIEDLYRREGISAAMRQFARTAGLDLADREPDVETPQPQPERIANLAFFLTHDAPAAHRHQLDRNALHAAAGRIVPAAGENTPAFPKQCAQALATELKRPLAEFPGGHAGFILHPRAFAARLDEVLAAAIESGP